MKELSVKIAVRIRESDRAELEEQADAAGLSISEYVRRRILGRRITSKVDLRVLAELRRLSGLIKLAIAKDAKSAETNKAMQALTDYTQMLLEKQSRKFQEGRE